ncbi:Paraplegin [Dactylella cylindrospora]|nr:Paraplegin [Dactylella cylindrospora]
MSFRPPRRGGHSDNRGGSLTHSLDKKIESLVRDLYEELRSTQDSSDINAPVRISTAEALNYIQAHDGALKRMKKNQLEKSVSKAIALVEQEAKLAGTDEDADDLDSDFEAFNDAIKEDNNSANKRVVEMWSTSTTRQPSNATTPAPESRSQMNGEEPSQRSKDAQTPGRRKRERTVRPEAPVKKQKIDRSPPTGVSLKDIGGIEQILNDIHDLIDMPLNCAVCYDHLGIQIPRGILLHGPPGCGKTMLANAIAAHHGVPFIPVSAPSVVSGMSGESEKKLREIFEEAIKLAPSIIFIDEIDAVMPKRESAQREMEKRIVAQMLTCMDGDFDFKKLAKMTPGFVGADLSSLTTAAGTFAIKRIYEELKVKRHNKPPIESEGVSLSNGAMDIDGGPALLNGETKPVVEDVIAPWPPLSSEELEGLSITIDDFLVALPKVQPSSKREGFATVPDVTWQQIGALEGIRKQLQLAIVKPIAFPEIFEAVGITAPAGVLLWGPPGCGKTLLAKAVANESNANFISVKGPELLNKWVGESERAVRQVFMRARASAPCVIFFDELDALAARRDDATTEATSRVVNTLLTELDGLNERKGIYVIAATNRPDMIDPAMLRPGRLDKALFVSLPTAEERLDILKKLTMKMPLHETIDLWKIAGDNRCHNFSGADLSSLVREAANSAVESFFPDTLLGIPPAQRPTADSISVSPKDFEKAFSMVRPSVSEAERLRFAQMKKTFQSV